MKYTIENFKKFIPDVRDLKIKERISKVEKKQLVRYGVIAGAAGAITVVTAIVIAKKLKKSKNTQIIEIDVEDAIEEEI